MSKDTITKFNIKYSSQDKRNNCWKACIDMISTFFTESGYENSQDTNNNLTGISKILQSEIGLYSSIIKKNKDINNISKPSILRIQSYSQGHFVVFSGSYQNSNEKYFIIQDPYDFEIRRLKAIRHSSIRIDYFDKITEALVINNLVPRGDKTKLYEFELFPTVITGDLIEKACPVINPYFFKRDTAKSVSQSVLTDESINAISTYENALKSQANETSFFEITLKPLNGEIPRYFRAKCIEENYKWHQTLNNNHKFEPYFEFEFIYGRKSYNILQDMYSASQNQSSPLIIENQQFNYFNKEGQLMVFIPQIITSELKFNNDNTFYNINDIIKSHDFNTIQNKFQFLKYINK
jgi:hypothetical protein